MSKYLTHFLDHSLIAAVDIDGLNPDSVRVHFSQGPFDVSFSWRAVESLPGRHRRRRRSSLALPLSVQLSASIDTSAVAQTSGKTSQYKVKSSTSPIHSKQFRHDAGEAVSKVSVQRLTQAIGFLMGLFSHRLTWQRLFSSLTLQPNWPQNQQLVPIYTWTDGFSMTALRFIFYHWNPEK